MSASDINWVSMQEDLLAYHQHQELAWGNASVQNGALEVESFPCARNSLTYSTENDENSKGNSISDSKKRTRDDSSNAPQGKAGREKVRRDKMNDRFLELSAVLEPDKPPKTDKASILHDAARIIGQLRVESQHYRDINNQLQETIKELKVEKNELREEKLMLKAEKEALEKRAESAHVFPPGYAGHVTAPGVSVATNALTLPLTESMHGLPTGFTRHMPAPEVSVDTSALASPFTMQSHHTTHAENGYNLLPSIQGTTPNHTLFYTTSASMSPYNIHNPSFLFPKPPYLPDRPSSLTMSQWIPSEVADVSKDHVLRPPVA